MTHFCLYRDVYLSLMKDKISTRRTDERSYPRKDGVEKTKEEVDSEVFKLQVYPRNEFKLESVDDNFSDKDYFKYESVNDQIVSIKISKSLEDLVDRLIEFFKSITKKFTEIRICLQRDPLSVLKFKLTCRGASGTEAAFLPITIYIQDVNDHAPEFLNAPYFLEVDEFMGVFINFTSCQLDVAFPYLTPVGLTVFRGLRAVDKDKPNTPNSDISYAIIGGNTDRTFALSDPIEGILIVNKQLDYDQGHREFSLQIQAADRGTPESLTSITTMVIKIKDSDDQNPRFTQDVYHVEVKEKPGSSGQSFAEKLTLTPAIRAIDQDIGINATVRYTIVGGNQQKFFAMDANDGSLYVTKEIDREKLATPNFNLQIQATQVDNSRRYGSARIDISILDVNDNPPVFEFELYNISVMENLPLHFSVLQVLALDEDQGQNGKFLYKIDDNSGPFEIDENAGWIRVFAVEKNPNVAPDAKPSFTVVEVHLLDANDNNPKFLPSSIYSFSVDETAPPGTIIGYVRAIDADLGKNGKVSYHMKNDSLSIGTPFGVESTNGTIFILDRFQGIQNKPNQYTIFVVAEDQPSNEFETRSSVAVVRININDINNSPPEFFDIPYNAFVGESLPPGTTVIQLKAKDRDSNTVLTFDLKLGNEDGHFIVDSKTGVVRTAVTLDYEKKTSYDMLVSASDGGNIATTPLSINVVDVNDQHPSFKKELYNFSIIEEMGTNLTVGHILAVDGDSGKNARVRYRLLGSEANKAFQIDDFGNIYTVRRLDREKEEKIGFTVVAFDAGSPQLSGTTNVEVTVQDINDNPPHFALSEYQVESEEEMKPPFIVHKLKAEDVDLGANANITYDIIGGNEDGIFGIEGESGLIYTKKKLDYEVKAQYVLIVRAKDVLPYQGPDARTIKNPTTAVIVQVKDTNDELVKFVQNTYSFNIKEDLARGSTVGLVNASNRHRASSEQQVSYWISRGNEKGKFWLNPKTGAIILLETVDRDRPGNERAFTFEVSAKDEKSTNVQNATSIIRVNINDVNDNSPKFDSDSYTLQIPENLPLGTEIQFRLKATDIDQGVNGKIIRYTAKSEDVRTLLKLLMYSMFIISPGTIILKASLDYEKKTKHTFAVIAMDGGNPPKFGSARVDIQVTDINEFSPEFTDLPYEFFAEENAGKGTSIGHVVAKDGDNNIIKYSISNGDADFFNIEEDTGKIYAAATLVSRSKYSFIATAKDDGSPKPRSLSIQVNVHIREANNHPPVFSKGVYNGYVLEKQKTDRVIVKVTASDQDFQNNTITYSLSSGNDEGFFFIDQTTGAIKLIPDKAELLDYDAREQYVLVVKAIDSHKTPLFGLAMINIEIRDINNHPPMFQKAAYSSTITENLPSGHCFLQVRAESGDSVDTIAYDLIGKTSPVLNENDNAPSFKKSEYYVTIPEGTRIGSSVIDVVAFDPDDANNGEVTYWLKNSHGVFEIDHKTGLVRLINRIKGANRGNASFMMEVFAQDHGVPSKLSKTKLIIELSDAKGRPPVFDKFVYSVNVDENVANIPLLTIKARNTDQTNSPISYSIVRFSMDHPISIDSRTGKISLQKAFDYEAIKYVELLVEARNGLKHPQIATTIVQIIVNDVNDNQPEFLKTPRLIRVSATTSQREVIYAVKAIDKDSSKDGNNKVIYEIEPKNPIFTIDQNTGSIRPNATLSPAVRAESGDSVDTIAYDLIGKTSPFSVNSATGDICTRKSLDREDKDQYKISVRARDGIFESLTHITILVQDENDNAPSFKKSEYYVTIPEGTRIGSSVIDVVAFDPDDANNGEVTYWLKNSHGVFEIDHKTGLVRLINRIKGANRGNASFMMEVFAQDHGVPSKLSKTKLIIELSDAKGRPPVFDKFVYSVNVDENVANIPLLTIKARNTDQTNSPISYSIVRFSMDHPISIDSRTGKISLQKAFDYEAIKYVELLVEARNGLKHPQIATTIVQIIVNDVNDNQPEFLKTPRLIRVSATTSQREVIYAVKAIDKDSSKDGNNKVIYEIEPKNPIFTIDQNTGSIRPNATLSPAVIPLRIIATDSSIYPLIT
ncbi:Protocadherin Fat 4 [Nymphon striatum]|nr:Protocadherin Fat 4 [Nymphon striatum]